jgi:predicted DNA-binding protein with PD1-like motif
METQQEGSAVVVKLSDGDDLFPSLEAAARKHQIESGSVLWGIGMLQDFELGYFGPKGYEKTVFAERHELLALHGSIAMQADPKLHLHTALARRDLGAIGGHLFRAKTAVVNEIQLARFDSIHFSRRFNEKTGMRELVLD